jgi:TolA-binding protein
VKLSVAALTWRGSQAQNPLLADLKPGLDAFRAQDYAAAVRELSPVAAKYPNAIEAHFYLGVSRLFLDDAQGALHSLTAADRLADTSFAPDVAWYLAAAHQRRGNVAEARRALTRVCAAESPRAAEACRVLETLK